MSKRKMMSVTVCLCEPTIRSDIAAKSEVFECCKSKRWMGAEGAVAAETVGYLSNLQQYKRTDAEMEWAAELCRLARRNSRVSMVLVFVSCS